MIDTDEYKQTNIFGKESEEYERKTVMTKVVLEKRKKKRKKKREKKRKKKNQLSPLLLMLSSLEEVDEEEDEGSLSGLSDFEYDEDGNLLESSEEDEESGEEDDDESDEIGLTRDQASVLSNLDPSIRNLPGMEEAMKELDI